MQQHSGGGAGEGWLRRRGKGRHQQQGEPGAESGRPGDLGGGPNITAMRGGGRRSGTRYPRKTSALMLAVDTREPTSEAREAKICLAARKYY